MFKSWGSSKSDREFPVEQVCPGEPPQRVWISVPASARVELSRDAVRCTLRLALDGLFLLGERGPTAPPGLVLGRAWGGWT